MNASSINNTSIEAKPMTQDVIKMIIYSLLAVTGLLSNSAILIVFSMNKSLRKSINYFILNMAISDLFVPVFAISIYLARFIAQSDYWQVSGKPGLWLCKIVYFFVDLSPLVSTFCLVFMSLDRYLAVVHPTRNYLRTASMRKYLIIVSWTVPIFYCFKDFHSYIIYANYCAEYWGPTLETHVDVIIVIRNVHSFVFILVPFLLMTFFYVSILLRLRKQHRRHRENISCPFQLELRLRQRKKINILTFCIVLAFGICYAPLYFYTYIKFSLTKWNFPSGFFEKFIFPALALAFANATINPLICILFNSQLRKILVGLLPCRVNKTYNMEYQYKLVGLNLRTIKGSASQAPNSTVSCINNNQLESRSRNFDDPGNSCYVIQLENQDRH